MLLNFDLLTEFYIEDVYNPVRFLKPDRIWVHDIVLQINLLMIKFEMQIKIS